MELGPLPYRARARAARRTRPRRAPAISAIVMKCLAKTAEDRYQTAAGLASDLNRCLAEWESAGRDRAVHARRPRHPRHLAHPREALRPRGGGRAAAGGVRPGRGSGRARTGPRLGLFRRRQVLGGERAAQGARAAARPVRRGQVRPVQARHSLCHPGAGLPGPDPPAARPERSRARPLAGRAARGAGAERGAHRRPGPRPEAHPRRAAARDGSGAAGCGTPLPSGGAALRRGVRPAGASPGPVPGRPAVAGRGDPGPARRSGDPVGGGLAAAGRGLSRQRGRPDPSVGAQPAGDPAGRRPE